MLDNITTIYRKLPSNVFAFTLHNAEDDWYTIVLNINKSYNQQKKSFDHEVAHILNNDFEVDKDVNIIECNSH